MANQVVKLKKGSDYLYPYSVLNSIDQSNELATLSINTDYTATQDCFALCFYTRGSGYTISFLINGINVFAPNGTGGMAFFPLSKGDVFKVIGGTDTGVFIGKLYGIKRTTN